MKAKLCESVRLLAPSCRAAGQFTQPSFRHFSYETYKNTYFILLQVTAYAHKDENNRFLVKRWNSEGRSELDFLDEKKMNESMEIELVRHGDLIRLEHITTRRNVHTHSEKAPLSKKQFQVTGYGEVGFDRSN